MPESGDVVVSGTEGADHRSLFMFSLKDGKLRVTKRLSLSCGHKKAAYISPWLLDGREQLVISCPGCDNIKQVDLQTGLCSTVFPGCKPSALCSAGNGTIFVQSRGDRTILQLDVTNPALEGQIYRTFRPDV